MNGQILFDDFIYVWNDADDNKPDRDLQIYEVSSFDSFNRSNTEQILDSYQEDGIKIECYDPDEIVFIDDDTIMVKIILMLNLAKMDIIM